MSKARDEVQKLIAEASSQHNDGWVMAGAKKKLTEIYEMIQNFLNKDATTIKADSSDEWIYESPDGQKVYRRKSGAPHDTRELIKG